MIIGISKEDLIKIYQEELGIEPMVNILWLADFKCKELDPWLPIKTSIVDNKEYLFVTKSKRQRVDRFHPSQHTTVNTDLRWQERPGDRYTHYKELPEVPKMKELQSEVK